MSLYSLLQFLVPVSLLLPNWNRILNAFEYLILTAFELRNSSSSGKVEITKKDLYSSHV